MIDYRPVQLPIAGRRLAAAPEAPAALPPAPDVLFAGYTGLPGVLETVLVLAATGAAAWIGIRTATGKERNPYVKAAGWVGGVGSALAGLLYLGTKSGAGDAVGLPALRISPY
jgi:hypothetical protein